MSGHGSINYTPLVPWLFGQAANTYTQFGEDGLVKACIDRIGSRNKECFEIGAHDGRFFSNTLSLREQGWSSVLIEGDPKQFAKLQAEFGESAQCVHSFCADLDSVLKQTSISKTPDFGVIDIDGQDYWLWHDMVNYRPRIMLVEISTMGETMPIPDRGQPFPAQAGLNEIKALGESKGYTLVATTYCNALLLENSCL